MNWKEKLAKELSHRKRGVDSVVEYLRIQKEVILPAFKEIVKILYDHSIYADTDNCNEVLTVKFGHINLFSMKIMLDYDKIKIEFSNIDTTEPPIESELILSSTKILAFEDVTEEKIGNEFYEAFKPMIKRYF